MSASSRFCASSLPLWTAVPVFTALHWWIRGVPKDRLALAETPSGWDRMSHRERHMVVVITVVVLVALVSLVAVALVYEG